MQGLMGSVLAAGGGASALRALACMAGFALGALASLRAGSALAASRSLRRSLEGGAGGPSSVVAELLPRGAVRLAHLLARRPAAARELSLVRDALAIRGLELSLDQAGGVLLVGAAAIGIATALLSSALVGALFAAAGLIGAHAWAEQARARQTAAIREGLPDALRALAGALGAGENVPGAFAFLARELPEPVRRPFARVSSAFAAGERMDEALGRLDAFAISELRFLSVALRVRHQAGGSIAAILAIATDAVEGELQLKRKLRAQTAQARLSAQTVVAVTFLLLGLMALTTEDFFGAFFRSPAGLAVFALACALQAAGVLAVRKLLDVEVES